MRAGSWRRDRLAGALVAVAALAALVAVARWISRVQAPGRVRASLSVTEALGGDAPGYARA